MGGCCGKTENLEKRKSLPQQKTGLRKVYSPRSGGSTVMVYDLESREAREETLVGVGEFQEGMATAVGDTGVMVCVGGVAEGRMTLIIDLLKKAKKQAAAPPLAIAYGRGHLFRSNFYLLGALDVSSDPQNWSPAVPLHYNIKTDSWRPLPPPPLPVCLFSSTFLKSSILTFGGVLNHPSDPSPCESVLTFDLTKETWEKLAVVSPIRTTMSVAATLEDNSVVIIGGYDPFDQVPESRDVFWYSNLTFSQGQSLPPIGKLRLNEAPVLFSNSLNMLSEDETLFTLHLMTREWTYVDITSATQTHETERMSIIFQREVKQSAWHYERAMCWFVEFGVKKEEFRKVAPVSFRNFVKQPGILMYESGAILIAGGIKAVSQDREELTDQVWVFDPISRLTVDFPILPAAQRCLRLLQLHGNIYGIAGVSDGENGAKSHCQVMREGAEIWELLPEMPYVTRCPGVAHFRGGIYCVAGESYLEVGMQFNLIQVFQLATSLWEVLRTEYPFGVCHLGIATLPSGLLCFGGLFLTYKPNSACFLFDGQSFVTKAKLLVSAGSHKSAYFQDPPSVLDGKVYVFAKTGALHIYNEQADQWRIVEKQE